MLCPMQHPGYVQGPSQGSWLPRDSYLVGQTDNSQQIDRADARKTHRIGMSQPCGCPRRNILDKRNTKMQNNELCIRPNRPSRRWGDKEGRIQAVQAVGRALRFVLHERKNHWRNTSQDHLAISRLLAEQVSEGPGWQLGGQEMSMEFKGGAVAVVEVERAGRGCESALCCYNRIYGVTTSCREKV